MLTSLFFFVGCEKQDVYGASLGSEAHRYIEKKMPRAKAKIIEQPEGIIEVKSEKIKGYVFDDVDLLHTIHEARVQGVKVIIPSNADTVDICVGISRVTKIAGLKDSLNAFIHDLKNPEISKKSEIAGS